MSTGVLIWNDDQLARLDLRKPVKSSGVVECAVTPLERAGTRLTPSNGSRAVASFLEAVPDAMIPMRPAALRLGDGRWAIVADNFGGGTHILQLAVVRSDLLAVAGRGSSTPRAEPKLIDHIKVPDAAEGRTFFNLTYPTLIEHKERLYIIASAGFLWDRPPMVVIAAADTYDKGDLRGRVMGQGFCPRVVKLGNEFVCAVRYADRHPDVKDPATPIRLYRSADLENWKQMPSPDESFRFTRFDLATDGEAICLLGVGEKNDTPVTKLLRFNAKAQVWTAKDAELSVPDAKTDVRLLPRSAQRAKMTAVVPDASGDLTVAELRAP